MNFAKSCNNDRNIQLLKTIIVTLSNLKRSKNVALKIHCIGSTNKTIS